MIIKQIDVCNPIECLFDWSDLSLYCLVLLISFLSFFSFLFPLPFLIPLRPLLLLSTSLPPIALHFPSLWVFVMVSSGRKTPAKHQLSQLAAQKKAEEAAAATAAAASAVKTSDGNEEPESIGLVARRSSGTQLKSRASGSPSNSVGSVGSPGGSGNSSSSSATQTASTVVKRTMTVEVDENGQHEAIKMHRL